MDRSTRFAAGPRRRIGGTWILAVLFLTVSFSATPDALAAPGDPLEVRELRALRAEDLAAWAKREDYVPRAPFPDRLRTFRVRYSTVDPHGNPAIASGLVIAPTDAALPPQPMLSVQHGTETRRDAVPSRNEQGLEVRWASLVYATRGYVVAMPDGLGLGDSDFPYHPFLHADSEAASGVHFVKAARTVLEEQGYAMSGQLFLSGYSQGGHWTMAMHRALERDPLPDFRLAAVAAMAGPFDVSGTMLRNVLAPAEPAGTSFLAYAFFAWQSVYRDIVREWSDGVREPYDEGFPALFDGTRSGAEVRRRLPRTLQELLQPEFVADVAGNPDHPLRRAGARNDVYDWTPKRPLFLVHSTNDATVNYRNSETAYTAMRGRGGNVHLVTLQGWGHVTAYPLAHAIAAERFERYREK